MSAPVHVSYTSELSKHFGYLPTWVPNYPLALGDVVLIDDRIVTQVDNLKTRGIQYTTRRGQPASYEYSSGEGVTLSHKLEGHPGPAGTALALVDAGVIVEFSKRKSVYFRATGCISETIEDKDALSMEMLRLYSAQMWKREHAVVTEIVRSDDTTILISAKESAKVELRAESREAGTAARLQRLLSRDMQTHIVSERGLTPLFRATGIRRRATDLFNASTGDLVLRTGSEAVECVALDFSDS